ncbi:MAG: DUF6285 domain-containing protein [Pseudomonadota bacterium]
MASHPSTEELVAAVSAFLKNTARPALSGHAAFHARVAENALAIVERELALGAAANQAAVGRLQALLGRDDGDRAALENELSDKIRRGDMDWATPGLIDHLKLTAIDQVKIDQPKYSGLAIATESL